jgi:Mn-dependent DtxR family transcriptional regulator
MNRLHEKGLISNPISKAKSVAMSEEGFKKAEKLFKKHFLNK